MNRIVIVEDTPIPGRGSLLQSQPVAVVNINARDAAGNAPAVVTQTNGGLPRMALVDDGGRLVRPLPPTLQPAAPTFAPRELFPYELPREAWPDLVAQFAPGWSHRCKPPTHSQNLVDRCNAAAVAMAVEFTRAAMGLPPLRFDDNDLYDGVPHDQTGSALGDILYRTENVGLAVDPSDDETARARFRAQWWNCGDMLPQFGSAFSAVAQGFPVIGVVDWKAGFQPDPLSPDAWLRQSPPPAPPVIPHCIIGYGPAARKKGSGLEFGIRCIQCRGAFSPRTANTVVLPESVLQTATFLVCRSVTYTA